MKYMHVFMHRCPDPYIHAYIQANKHHRTQCISTYPSTRQSWQTDQSITCVQNSSFHCIYSCVQAFIHTHTHTHVHKHIHAFTNTQQAYAFLHIRKHIHKPLQLLKCQADPIMYVCMDVCIHTPTHTPVHVSTCPAALLHPSTPIFPARG